MGNPLSFGKYPLSSAASFSLAFKKLLFCSRVRRTLLQRGGALSPALLPFPVRPPSLPTPSSLELTSLSPCRILKSNLRGGRFLLFQLPSLKNPRSDPRNRCRFSHLHGLCPSAPSTFRIYIFRRLSWIFSSCLRRWSNM